jgi:hypothetical protein
MGIFYAFLWCIDDDLAAEVDARIQLLVVLLVDGIALSRSCAA